MMVSTAGMNAFATYGDIHTLIPTPPINNSVEITPFGSSAPPSSASTHDVSISDYNYQVQKMGYQVYTDKWLTGASSIIITVENWNVVEDYGGTNDKVTIKVYNSSNTFFDSKAVTIKNGIGSASFSRLTPTSKYYVCFEVGTNSNKYSFNGAISKG